MSLRYGSVCSGIEAASVAWHPLGWQPMFFSEIEAFPSSVLAHHWPDVPNLGDFTTIEGAAWPIDVLVGGTPCQAFSMAGLRKGLNDARGNLTLSFVELVHATVTLRYALWENVPGVLSDDTNAFGCLLAGLVGADDPLRVPGEGRWPDAGMVAGPLGRAAWRILDAQYFGVPQRRRRIFVVFCPSASGGDPASVLFECKGVPGDFAASGGAEQDVTGTLSARASGGGGLGTDFDLAGGLQIAGPLTAGMAASASRLPHEQGALIPAVAGTLLAAGRAAGSATQQDAEAGLLVPAFTCASVAPPLTQNPLGDHDGREGLLVAHTLRAEGFDASEDGTGRQTLIPVIAFDCKASGQNGFGVGEIMSTLRSMGHSESHKNGGGHAAVAYPIIADATRNDSSAKIASPDATGRVRLRDPGLGIGDDGDPMFTLQTAAPHSVAWSIMPQNSGKDFKARPVDVAQPLMAGGPVGGNQGGDYIQQSYGVRRLTPIECARLQGFPDDHTNLAKMRLLNKPTADGPQYKAYGNSMAVPVMRWIGVRIAADARRVELERAA